jgi:hypothetical protein
MTSAARPAALLAGVADGGRVLAQNLLLEAELLKIADALVAARLPFAVLKGIPLSRELQHRLPARRLWDNDIWVRPTDARRAAEVLRRLGYRRPPYYYLEPEQRFLWQCPLMNTRRNTTVDLHWRLLPPNLFKDRIALSADVLRVVQVQRHPIPVLGRELAIVQLAAHYAQHQCAEPRILLDLVNAIRRWRVEPSAVMAQAKRARTVHALSCAIHSAARLGLFDDVSDWPLSSRAQLFLSRFPPAPGALARDPIRYLASHVLGDSAVLVPAVLNDLFPSMSQLSQAAEQPKHPALYRRYLTRNLQAAYRLLRPKPPRRGSGIVDGSRHL